jgi:outer membrane autotransporter protein
MKNRFLSFLLASISVCLLCQAPLYAQNPTSWSFNYKGNISTWAAPQAGNYTITAYGAQGGGSYLNMTTGVVGLPGGLGAIIGGRFQLSANQTLNILAGGMGVSTSEYAGGGGGGSFVVDSSSNPLVVAGGGGGSGSGYGASPVNPADYNGQTTTWGGSSYNEASAGGSNGQGGTIGENSSDYGGAGGGGFVFGPIGNGGTHYETGGGDKMMAQGGFSYLNGGAGGASGEFGGAGGFGGGGAGGGLSGDASHSSALGGGGGGGGYSGGAGGVGNPDDGGGGGGGSYLASYSSNQTLLVGNTGNGMVSISLIGGSEIWTGNVIRNLPATAVFYLTEATQAIGASNTISALNFTNSTSLAIDSTGLLSVTSGNLNVQTGTSVITGGTLTTPGNFNKTGAGELDVQSKMVVGGTASINEGLLTVNGQLTANTVVVGNSGNVGHSAGGGFATNTLGGNGGHGELLTVNGQITANSVVVNQGGTLGGSGAIFAPVTVYGTLSPGNSPGTLSMAALTLTPTAVTDIEIESLTNFDRLVVGGAATVDGTLNVIPYNGNPLDYGQQYAFLTAGGGITGEFDTINAPATFRGRFLNLGTTGVLLIAPDTYTRVAVTPNQREVAQALDSFIPATSGDRETVSIALDLQTAEQYPYAFEQIMPGFYESLANIAIEQAFAQTQMLNQRISSVRLGAAGFQAIGGISQPLVNDKNGKSVAEAKDASPIVESATATNWNAWALGTGMFSRTTNLGSMDNYNNNAGGFLVGTDYRWSENFVTGLYGGYDYSYAEYNGGGSTKGNSFSFGTYASYAKDGYYADAVIGGGYTGFQTKRSIEFSTIDRTASADPGSGQFTAGLNLGKDFEVGKFTLGPIVGAQYTYAGIGSFTESGAESLDLSLGQQNANSLRSTLGGRIAYTWNLNQKIALFPEVRMFWQHEFLNNPRNISASLDGGNGAAFDFETSDPYRNSVFAGAGVTAQFGKNLSGSVFYNINFGSQTYQSNMVSAGLNFSF